MIPPGYQSAAAFAEMLREEVVYLRGAAVETPEDRGYYDGFKSATLMVEKFLSIHFPAEM